MIIAMALALSLLASPVDQLGFGSHAAGLAGATVAWPSGAGIGAYNPAVAAGVDDLAAGAGYSYAAMDMRVNGTRHSLDPARAVHLGLAVPFSLGRFGRVGASFAMSLPDERLIRTRVLPIDRPRFLMYDNRLQRTSVDGALAYAYSLGPWSFGAAFGLTLLGDAAGEGATFRLSDQGAYQRADAGIKANLPIVASPLAAAFVRFGDFHAGILLRMPLQFDVHVGTNAAIQLDAITGNVYTAVASTDFYTPLELAGGLAWIGDRLRVHLAVEYLRWSDAPQDIEIVGDVDFEGIPVSLPIANTAGDTIFTDVVIPRLGVEVALPPMADTWQICLRAGGFYEATPVVSSSLLLDNDRIGATFGAGIASVDSVWFFPRPVSLDAHLLVIGMLPRIYESAGVSAPRPDLEITGLLISAGLTATLRF